MKIKLTIKIIPDRDDELITDFGETMILKSTEPINRVKQRYKFKAIDAVWQGKISFFHNIDKSIWCILRTLGQQLG